MSTPDPTPATPRASVTPAGAVSIPTVPRRAWAAALVAGVAAGVVAWLGGEAIRGTFQPVERSAAAGPALDETERLIKLGLTKEATLAFVMLGAALGLAGGLAGGL